MKDREGLQSCTHTSKPHMPIPPKPHAHTLLKQPLHLSVHSTHRTQPNGGRHRLSSVSQHQRPAVNARDSIKPTLCVCVCVAPIVHQALTEEATSWGTNREPDHQLLFWSKHTECNQPAHTDWNTAASTQKTKTTHMHAEKRRSGMWESIVPGDAPTLWANWFKLCVQLVSTEVQLLWTQGRRCGDTPRARQDDTLETSWTLTYNKAQTSRRRGSPPRGYAADARPILWRAPSTQTRRGRANIKAPACPLSHSQRALPRMHKLNASHLFYPTGRPCCSERKQTVALHPAGIIAHQPRSELRLSRLISCSRVGMKEADRVSGLIRGQTQHGASVSASWVYHTLHGWFHPD